MARLGFRTTLVLVAAAALVGLAGCTEASGRESTPQTDPVSTASVPPATVSPSPGVTPVPTLAPMLSASENLTFFDSVNLGVIAADAGAQGRDFIDALVAAGFDRAAMEVTDDRTTVDLPADSVLFAVRLGDECLVGQYGPASNGYRGAVGPALGTGGCLVGQTRPIDW